MIVMTNERPSIRLSLEEIDELSEANGVVEEAKRKARELQPLCPDGSGELGIFDKEASDRNGGIMIYKTESGKYFHWVDTVKKGSVLDPGLHDFE